VSCSALAAFAPAFPAAAFAQPAAAAQASASQPAGASFLELSSLLSASTERLNSTCKG
jgi:hypothetical protein